jgi:hypothetical protein
MSSSSWSRASGDRADRDHGQQEFDKEALKKGLKQIGLAESRIYDRALLDRAEQELKRQYISKGKYGVKITTTVTPLDRNRVSITFNINEGDVAKIRSINIVGNKAFPEKELLSQLNLTTPGWLTWYTKNDQYSKQKLAGDLETLHPSISIALPRVRHRVHPGLDHARQENIYITINVSGPQFRVSDIARGDLIAREQTARQVEARGDFLARETDQSTRATATGSRGYAFANVNAARGQQGGRHGQLCILRRSGPARLHPAHQYLRQHAHPGRGHSARDAADGGGLVRLAKDPAFQAARRQARLLQRGERRDAGGARHDRSGGRQHERGRAADRERPVRGGFFERRQGHPVGVGLAKQHLRFGQRADAAGQWRQGEFDRGAVLYNPYFTQDGERWFRRTGARRIPRT